MNKDTDGEGKDANGWNARKNGKKFLEGMNPRPWRTSQGGGGGTTRCGLRPFPERRQLQKK